MQSVWEYYQKGSTYKYIPTYLSTYPFCTECDDMMTMHDELGYSKALLS